MKKLRYVFLGPIDPVLTQVIWHAAAIALSEGDIPPTLFIDWPASPLVSCGYFQEVSKEVDIEFCRKMGIPIVRRVIGGGAVYLDENQIFYQLVIPQDWSDVPADTVGRFEYFLRAPVQTYRELGVDAYFRPVNDIEVNGRKISGNGGGEIEKAFVFVGNIILDFNYDIMVKVLRVPSEKFRDKFAKSLKERVTSLRRELGYVPDRSRVVDLLVKNFEKYLNVKLERGELTRREEEIIRELREQYLSHEWLFIHEERHPNLATRKVKVAGDTYIVEGVYKSPGGLIRVTFEMEDEVIRDILISGDFWLEPRDAIADLENSLKGLRLDKNLLKSALVEVFESKKIRTSGTSPEDFVNAILTAYNAH